MLLGDGVGRGVLVGDGVADIGRSPRCWDVASFCSDCADTAESDPVAEAEKIHTKPPNVRAAPSENIAMRAAFGSRLTSLPYRDLSAASTPYEG